MGKRSWRGGTPRDPKASSSLSDASRPTAIKAPTSDPKGNENAMTMGREKTISRSTSQERHLLGEDLLRHDQDLVEEEQEEEEEERDDEGHEVFARDVAPGDLMDAAPSAASLYTETPPPRVPKKTLGGLQAIPGTSRDASPSRMPMRLHEPSALDRTLTPPPKLPKYSARSVSQPERIQSSAIPSSAFEYCLRVRASGDQTARPSPYVPIQILPSRAGRIVVMFPDVKSGIESARVLIAPVFWSTMTSPTFIVPTRSLPRDASSAMQVMNLPGRLPSLTVSRPELPRRRRPSPSVPAYRLPAAARTTWTLGGRSGERAGVRPPPAGDLAVPGEALRGPDPDPAVRDLDGTRVGRRGERITASRRDGVAGNPAVPRADPEVIAIHAQAGDVRVLQAQ